MLVDNFCVFSQRWFALKQNFEQICEMIKGKRLA